MKTEIMKRIEKCLALARNNPNENEVIVALKHANALMVKHGITESDIEKSSVTVSEAVKARKGSIQSQLATVVAKAFGCEAVLRVHLNEVQFYGVNSRPELARYAFDVLLSQLSKAKREYLKTLAKDIPQSYKTKLGNSFAMGWINRVYSKVKEFANPSPEIVKTYIREELNIRLVKTRKRNLIGSAYKAGSEAGINAQLHNPVNTNEMKAIA